MAGISLSKGDINSLCPHFSCQTFFRFLVTEYYDNRLKEWIRRFHRVAVATRYLGNYLAACLTNAVQMG